MERCHGGRFSGSPTRGGAIAGGISPAPQRCLRRSGRQSSAMLTGSLRLMEISTASSRQAMTTDSDAVARIETCAQKSVYCYEFCYGEERQAETKVPPSAQLVAGQ